MLFHRAFVLQAAAEVPADVEARTRGHRGSLLPTFPNAMFNIAFHQIRSLT